MSQLTDWIAQLESGGSSIDGPSGSYSNYRYQQFPGFVSQYGASGAGVENYANQVLAANPNATFGDFYSGYVLNSGNPANLPGVGALQNPSSYTSNPAIIAGAQGAYSNLISNYDPNTPLASLMGNSGNSNVTQWGTMNDALGSGATTYDPNTGMFYGNDAPNSIQGTSIQSLDVSGWNSGESSAASAASAAVAPSNGSWSLSGADITSNNDISNIAGANYSAINGADTGAIASSGTATGIDNLSAAPSTSETLTNYGDQAATGNYLPTGQPVQVTGQLPQSIQAAGNAVQGGANAIGKVIQATGNTLANTSSGVINSLESWAGQGVTIVFLMLLGLLLIGGGLLLFTSHSISVKEVMA